MQGGPCPIPDRPGFLELQRALSHSSRESLQACVRQLLIIRTNVRVSRPQYLHAVMREGSTPTALPPWASSRDLFKKVNLQYQLPNTEVRTYHSCHVGTPSTPRFRSCQLLSNCFAAWLKYRPSVERAALLREMIAVPADPENPEMNSMQVVSGNYGWTQGGGTAANLVGHHMVQCTRTGGCLPKERLDSAGQHPIMGD